MGSSELSFVMKIWGDISNLTKSLNKGKDEVKTFGKGTDASFKDLTKSVSIAENQFKKFAVQMGVNSKEAQAALKEYHRLKSEINEINGALRPQSKQSMFSGLSGELAGVATGFLGITALAGGVGAFFTSAISGAMEDERAAKKLTFALNGNSAAANRMLAFKDKLMQTTLFSEDEIMNVINLGLSMGRTEQQTQNMVKTAMGFANATGKELNEAFMQINKTLGGFAGELGESIPELKNLTSEQLKNGAAVDLLYQKYGKFAGDGLDTTYGKVEQAKKAWEEFGDSIGARVLPVLGDLINKLNANVFGSSSAKIADLQSKLQGEKNRMAVTGIKGKTTASEYYEKEIASLTHVQSLEESIAKMRAWTPEVQKQGNPMVERLKKQLEVQEEITKAAKETADARQKDLDNWGKWLNFKAQGGMGPTATFGQMGMGNEAISKAQSINPFAISSPVNTNKVQQGAAPGGDIKTTLTDWMEAIDEVAAKAQGLDAIWQNVFRSFSTFAAKASTGFKEGWKDAMSAAGDMIQAGIGAISELFGRSNNKRLEELDLYYNKERENIESSKMNDKQKAKALEKLDNDTAAKRKALMIEQAKQHKIASLFQATVAGSLAIVQAFASGGLLLGLLMTGLVGAQIANIIAEPPPALAEGGLAMAPTLAMVGDNPNARIDPEVIAPLSKLRDMLNPGEATGVLTARVSGDDLLFVMDRAQRSKQRRY